MAIYTLKLENFPIFYLQSLIGYATIKLLEDKKHDTH